jgi:hypothetical protein
MEDPHDSWSTTKLNRSAQKAVHGWYDQCQSLGEARTVSLNKRSQPRQQPSTRPLYSRHPRSILLSRQEMGVHNS